MLDLSKLQNSNISELKCPGDCNNAGICDTSNGQCSCDNGRHGSDCSSKYEKVIEIFLHLKISFSNLVMLEFDCPGDGSCSSQGVCDDTIGTCICNEGFEGSSCQGKFSKA